jgi:hypothetical protein
MRSSNRNEFSPTSSLMTETEKAEDNRSIPQAAFTVDEFCKRNDMCRATFYGLLKSGQLKAKKRGARTIILAADEHAWLNALPDYVSPIGRQPGKAA